MMFEPGYKEGRRFRVRLDGHAEPVDMVSIEQPDMCAGGGVMLIADRGPESLAFVLSALNAWAGNFDDNETQAHT
jgi:hypothetical protein